LPTFRRETSKKGGREGGICKGKGREKKKKGKEEGEKERHDPLFVDSEGLHSDPVGEGIL